VAAESSFTKRTNKFCIGILWIDTWLPERIPAVVEPFDFD
jgi:hypothetical protein